MIRLLLCLALVPAPVLGQTPHRDVAGVDVRSTAVAFDPTSAGRVPRFSIAAERTRVSAQPQRRVKSRDSLMNGVIIGAVIGAVAFGAFTAALCHAYQEQGDPSCVPDTLRVAAIGGAIGTGAGLAIDAARSHRGVTVRLAIRF